MSTTYTANPIDTLGEQFRPEKQPHEMRIEVIDQAFASAYQAVKGNDYGRFMTEKPAPRQELTVNANELRAAAENTPQQTPAFEAMTTVQAAPVAPAEMTQEQYLKDAQSKLDAANQLTQPVTTYDIQ